MSRRIIQHTIPTMILRRKMRMLKYQLPVISTAEEVIYSSMNLSNAIFAMEMFRINDF
jgi:hypothetical protein